MKVKNHRFYHAVGITYSWITAATVVIICLLIILVVFLMGKDTISLDFLIREPNPSVMDESDTGGISTPLIGSVILTLIGILIAFPISLATSIFIVYYSKKGIVSETIGLAVDVIAGIPTIVIALFSLAIFTNPAFLWLSTPVQNDGGEISMAYGRSFLTAGMTMAIMILPFVTKSMIEALKVIPRSHMDGSLALGADKWRTITKVAIPGARRGLITGTILGMGRIIGDTAIVWLTLGGTLRMTGIQPWFMPQNWLSTLRNTGSTLTSYIYYTSPAGEGNNLEVAFGASLVLIILIIILNTMTAVLGNIGANKKEGEK
ncbi:MAG: PstA family ABC transporter permease [Eubacteriales bacterium]